MHDPAHDDAASSHDDGGPGHDDTVTGHPDASSAPTRPAPAPRPAERFNLSALALRFPQVTLFFLLVFGIGGALALFQLGQREDPDFTFRAMVVRTQWPGATARQVDEVVTDRIEKTLQEVPYFKRTTSYSKAGESMIVLELKDSSPAKEVPNYWYQVRKKVGDIRWRLPADIRGPFFNDEFGDVFGTIYALTGDGIPMSALRRHAEAIRAELLKVPDVAKIELVGVQPEQIHIDISPARLATLGITPQMIARELAAQNLITPAGTVHTDERSVRLEVSGQFDNVKAIQALRLTAGNRIIRLGDIATVRRGYADPPTELMHFGGREAIGIAISMVPNGDVLQLGRNLDARMQQLRADLPVGVEYGKVSDQPKIVGEAVGIFIHSLMEAVIIVLAVSLLSLGLRAGLVVALSIPLVLAATFLGMKVFGIDLHRVSTGALIIALGLLVDDAMIAIEMMARKLEEGLDTFSAATYAYTSTAFPMLTGTLITAVGFLPIATARSSTGEYTFTIFAVVTLALLISWVMAVGAVPFIGSYLLKAHPRAARKTIAAGQADTPGSLQPEAGAKDRPDTSRAATVADVTGQPAAPDRITVMDVAASPATPADPEHDLFDTPFYRRLRATIEGAMRHRWLTLLVTLVLLVAGIFGMGLTTKQFFPDSNRAEFLVDLWLPEGASLAATRREAEKLEKWLAADPDAETFVAYIGNGSPRYFLSLDKQLYRTNYAQFVVLTKDLEARQRLLGRLRPALDSQFPGVRTRAYPNPLGPPVAFPVQFRVSGPDIAELKRLGADLLDLVNANPYTYGAHMNWGERAPTLKVDVDQDRARAVGLSSGQISRALGAIIDGTPIGTLHEDDQLIPVVIRAPEAERTQLSTLGSLQLPTARGGTVPLSPVARLQMEMDEPIIWRRSRVPTLTVNAEVLAGMQGRDVMAQIEKHMKPLRARLPAGYHIDAGGPVEGSDDAQASINAGMPLMVGLVLTLLMLQLRSFSLVAMVVLTAPLGIVGIVAALLVSGMPFGFVAMLGTIALAGIIMRNTVILVEQIRQDIEAGHSRWHAVREATVRRFRPITLTAAAAILAMIPLSRDVLWGPMAVAIMGGLVVATALTLLMVPALYVTWYRIRPPSAGEEQRVSGT